MKMMNIRRFGRGLSKVKREPFDDILVTRYGEPVFLVTSVMGTPFTKEGEKEVKGETPEEFIARKIKEGRKHDL